MKIKKRFWLSTISFVLVLSLFLQTFMVTTAFAVLDEDSNAVYSGYVQTGEEEEVSDQTGKEGDNSPEDKEAALSAVAAEAGEVGNVRLITGDVLEIEYSVPVLSNAEAQALFKILVDEKEVEWEYLSYFDFGSYAAKPVVNVRMKDALDVGEPRGRRRTNATEVQNLRTEHIRGPIAAARITVGAGEKEVTPAWFAFYLERTQNNMGRYYAYASRSAGNNGTMLLLQPGGAINDNNNVFSATAEPRYTDEYIARIVGEGMNKMTGRMEYLNLPMMYAGFKALLVGPTQSVYEVPEYRDLYVHGATTDTFTRTNIKASDVPGNLNVATGEFKRPFIVGTADDVMQHYAPIKADGTPAANNEESARPKEFFFHFGEAFMDAYYELGVKQGSWGWPLTPFNKFDDYRFDLHVEEAYDKAVKAGMWPNTKAMKNIAEKGTEQYKQNLKDYFVLGAMVHNEWIPDSRFFTEKSAPVNTRYELQEYDYPLYWAIGGVLDIIQWWMGLASVATSSDGWKNGTKWSWQQQVDNYGLPATPNGTEGAPYPPLAIQEVEVLEANRLLVRFNREVSSLAAATAAANYRAYVDGREIAVSVDGGHGWRSIILTSSGTANRFDNGRPYGRSFSGFTLRDRTERSIAAGGWISNTQSIGANALEMGDYVDTERAIREFGAGLAGKVEVAYVGSTAANTLRGYDGIECSRERVEAEFKPLFGGIYRTPATGYYIQVFGAIDRTGYYDNTDGTKRVWVPGYYMLRNEPEEHRKVGAKEVAMAAGHQYEALFTNNRTITYADNAGNAARHGANDFDFSFNDNNNTIWNLTVSPGWGLDYTWSNGVVTRSGQTMRKAPITYQNPGQRTVDGGVRGNGACRIACTSVQGYHNYRIPGRGLGSINELRVEGNGGGAFDSVDVAVIRDVNLVLYRNENLIMHEGGHGIDSNLAGTNNYGQHIYNDFTAAFATATNPKNGMRWFTTDGVRAYTASRPEYCSMGANYFSGSGREQFEGLNDGIWTPINTREETFRYDPYSYEAHKRLIHNGDLGLWYENKVGDPDYRVIEEDWEILRDQNPQFSHWKGVDNLIMWGMTINTTARHNPYTGQSNPLIRWISYGNPAMWDVDKNFAEPYYTTGWRQNIRYDWAAPTPYYEPEDPAKPPTKSIEHPFFSGAGVPMPNRPPEIAKLVEPVGGEISNVKMGYSPVIVEFDLTGPTGEVNMNNAAASFELFVGEQLTHFYFWTFKETAPGVAKVELRMEWPIEPEDYDKVTVIERVAAVEGEMGAVRLITGDVLEIEFSNPVLTNASAQKTFEILVDGQPAEWEYLSYFDFGDYKAAPVVNVRLKEGLDAGEPRGRRRTTATEVHNLRTENVRGPIAAARITVKAGEEEKKPTWFAFYLERSQNNMGRYYAYASRKAGNNGTMLLLQPGGAVNDTNNIFSATAEPRYTDEYIVRIVGEGMNKMTGRMEYLNLPMIYAGFKALLVGPTQSVYEVPEYRDLYKHGVTTDTFTRTNIKASDVPGNLNSETGEFLRPFIVGTADDVMQHYAPIKADGTPAANDAESARPKGFFFHFGEAFMDAYYELGVKQGSWGWPLTPFTKWDEYRYDIHVEEAYDKAVKAGMWPNTKPMKNLAEKGTEQYKQNLKDYFILGAMVHNEWIPDSQYFTEKSAPINTRYELQDYDYPLYWACGGVLDIIQYWTGLASVSVSSDTWKNGTKWSWQQQVDNYGLPATPNGTEGAPYPPLAIQDVEVQEANRLLIRFNREVSSLAAATVAANYRIYINDRAVTPSLSGGHGWRSLIFTTSGTADRLDNGRPYGTIFRGFTQRDIDERSVAAGGWIANNQAVGQYALEMGDYVTTQRAIEEFGAGLVGKVEVAYVGSTTANAVRGYDGIECSRERVAAKFEPVYGCVYRTPATGYYFHIAGAVDKTGYYDNTDGTKRVWVPGYYMLRNEPEELRQVSMVEVAMAAGHQYEALFTNNRTTVYPDNAGNAAKYGANDFDFSFNGNRTEDWDLTNPSWGLDYTWNNGVVTRGSQTMRKAPITYNNPGQRVVDGGVRGNGGGRIACTTVQGYSNHRIPGRSLSTINEIRVEGNGGPSFDSVDAAVVRDNNLALYRNENLVMHEGGHGIDSNLPAYAQNIYNDITAAFATATNPKNGMRWFTTDGLRNYCASRSEYVSMGTTYFAGVMREQFEGTSDGIWGPTNNRDEIFRYDPYSYEAHKRLTHNGDLSLWYENRMGDPDYRVIEEDWELLRDQNPQFAGWKGVDDLIKWGMTISPTANFNPYTGQSNPLIKWISYANAAIWDVEKYAKPYYTTGWRQHIRFDWESDPYFPNEDTKKPPFKNKIHPFYEGDGIKRPVRPADIEKLVKPVMSKTSEISNVKMGYSPVIVDFDLTGYNGEVNMNNAAASFELKVNGQLTHFYFWTFKETAPGVAKVQLRMEWPIDKADYDKVTVTRRVVPTTALKIDAAVTETVQRGKVYNFALLMDLDATRDDIVWSLSDPSFALIDNDANVYILNKTGTVRLIASDPISGLTHSITLRIAS